MGLWVKKIKDTDEREVENGAPISRSLKGGKKHKYDTKNLLNRIQTLTMILTQNLSLL